MGQLFLKLRNGVYLYPVFLFDILEQSSNLVFQSRVSCKLFGLSMLIYLSPGIEIIERPILFKTMKKAKLKDLKDGAAFKLSAKSQVVYYLQTIDEKKRQALYTSVKSNRTFKAGWGKIVFI